jgi:O-antigen ligase
MHLLLTPYGGALDDKRKLAADWLAAGVLLVLPWSTSATAILTTLFVLAVAPDVARADGRRSLALPALALPLLLWALAVLGMFWAEVSWSERLQGLRPFHKLLALPLIFLHFRHSRNASKILAAFAISATILLLYSWASFIWPSLVVGNRAPGVPVKDRIYQGMIFVLLACACIYFALETMRERPRIAAALFALAALLIANVVYVAHARTALVVLPVLLALVGIKLFGARGVAAMLALSICLGALAWATSPSLRLRMAQAVEGVMEPSPQATPNESLRLEWWRNSLTLLQAAPLVGHGTGSIGARLAALASGPDAAASNPHNQSFFIGIQLGSAGVAILYLMWGAHLLLFRRESWPAALGGLVVVQNIVSSLFNSHLADFTAGWFYVFGVGILGALAHARAARGAGEPLRVADVPVR